MRTALLFAGVLGLTGLSSGQAQRQATVTRVVYAPDTEISATDLRHDANRNTVFARGAVQIKTGSTTIVADDADIRPVRSTPASVEGMSRPLLKLGGGSVEILRDVLG